MSNHVDKAFSETDRFINGTVDKTFSAGMKTNDMVTKFIQSPEERKKIWGSAKKYPLAYVSNYHQSSTLQL